MGRPASSGWPRLQGETMTCRAPRFANYFNELLFAQTSIPPPCRISNVSRTRRPHATDERFSLLLPVVTMKAEIFKGVFGEAPMSSRGHGMMYRAYRTLR